ncbi:MAG: ABC transporter substrate-binding protein, partial [Chloroflexota bacterium]
MKGIRKGFVKVGFFALGLVLGISLLAACAAPIQQETPSPTTPVPTAPSPPAASPSAPSPETPTPVIPPAVAPSPAAQFPMEITDQLGRVVTLKKMPQRIVSIAPSNTEILFALGLGDRVVGVDQYSNYPAAAATKAIVGGYSTANVEKIVALSPDLVLATSIHQPKVIPVLESLGYTVVALDPKTVDAVLDAIALVGKITGKQAEAAEVVTGLSTRIKAVTDKTASLTNAQRPRVFYVVWYDPLMSSGNGTFQADLIQKAG